MDLVLGVVGVAAVVLGGAGVLGKLDRTSFSLYTRHGTKPVPPEQHRRLQRLGGAFMLVAGVVFVVTGLTR